MEEREMRSDTTNSCSCDRFASRHGRERGLTLVEILAVVVILGFLAATLAVGFSGSFGKAKHELAKTGIGQIVDKVEAYRIEKGSWPTNDLGLRALSDGYAVPTDSYFLDAGKLLDPWKRPYYYVTPGPNQYPYEILTYGADGVPGGTGEDADVSSVDLRGEK
jgi:general secretion pathway protein G